MKRLALLAAATLTLSACGAVHAEAEKPWNDGGAGLSYRVASDDSSDPAINTRYEIRADKDCPLIFTENIFYDKDGVILYGGGELLKDDSGAFQKLAAGQVITATLGFAGDGVAKSKINSVTCEDRPEPSAPARA